MLFAYEAATLGGFPLIEMLSSIIGGAFVSGVPLYIMWRKSNLELREKRDAVDATNRINLEAEWKRLLDLRTNEITRMTERDNQQQKQLDDLQAAHVECQKNEARSFERIKMNEERIKWLETQIIDLKTDLLATKKVRKRRDAVPSDAGPASSIPSDEPAPGPG